ncbi:MAG: hypothetical protein ACRDQ4_26800 [Pseudonocardiaceae bacterium]
MSTASDTGSQWAQSPRDSRSQLLPGRGEAPLGMRLAVCGQLMPCSVDTSPTSPPVWMRCPSCTSSLVVSVPDPVFTTLTPADPRLSAAPPVPGGRPDPITGHGPARHWARCPVDGLLHAIARLETEQATESGFVPTLCGQALPAQSPAVQDVHCGALCVACVLAVTA